MFAWIAAELDQAAFAQPANAPFAHPTAPTTSSAPGCPVAPPQRHSDAAIKNRAPTGSRGEIDTGRNRT